ncbi:indolepyruvate ferredoxin oxidoreductase subunit alpha [Mediterraneibacter glycyrrhizinilyticus]|uniref:Indolepyruvate oxidoreductase subunit IorA n=2 Tax=Bacteria TaxID=2 RepID=A0A9D2SS45_9FIRM|nr:indolepyruvate ferredoxin oxidoreductase subunit alpha [Mediterraneibacter glycyrrhizinilyticus]MBM6801833.1 indolepyruvate ferredoxin oxidoreductase subunit alpha [Mediterraneibacter glycyrrhizinilyticus]MDM8126553.1 indolepyruvate ferredoxin oxidoreductase subunit alpha [Mediterraneibacter glycyrrhizinilyticus]HJC33207.1 indolepyruvate ferredoxin oxidoreductase subunit alpha [Candidatus Mediterraneibacter faecipullorum]
MGEKVIMLGNEAIARGAYEAGVKVSSAYPGTPSTEISEYLVQYRDDVYEEWAPNEKVATEVAVGASLAGVRSMACMKHVGLNVAADPLYSVSYMGVNGGLVIVVADDPGLYSSQNEQDTRMVARAAQIPVIEPSDSAEAKDYFKIAFELSEKFDRPFIFRTTTRLAHSQGLVELQDRVVPEDKVYEKNIQKNVMMPGNAKIRHIEIEKRNLELAEAANTLPINRVEMNDTKIGVITSGIPYQYVKEAMPEASVLKLGMVNPLPRKLIEDFASKVDTLYIVEELDPVIEEQVKSWGINAIGKEILTVQGEYSANMLRKAILKQDLDIKEPAAAPGRPPILCPGCPHRSVFYTLNKLKMHAAGDIGCYTLGAVAPLSVIDTTMCMGSSISTLHGMEKAKGKDYIKNWVAVIGDSTFMHTGVNSLMNMVYNKATGTVIILDNSTTGMTGHQDHAATGKTLQGDPTYAISIPGICKAMGIKNVYEINAFDLPLLEKTIKEEVAKDEISVIITKTPCVLLDKRKKPLYVAHEDKCKKCGMCMKPGCPAMTKNADGTIHIDDTMCTGCGLCKDLCKFDAIELVREGE